MLYKFFSIIRTIFHKNEVTFLQIIFYFAFQLLYRHCEFWFSRYALCWNHIEFFFCWVYSFFSLEQHWFHFGFSTFSLNLFVVVTYLELQFNFALFLFLWLAVYRGNSNIDSVTSSAILNFYKIFLAFNFVNLCFPAKFAPFDGHVLDRLDDILCSQFLFSYFVAGSYLVLWFNFAAF